MPKAIQRNFFDRYRFKTVPLIVLWVELQRRLWSAPRTPSDPHTREI
jgi:hypothetical protein